MNVEYLRISKEERLAFQKDGVVLLKNVISRKWRSLIAEAVKRDIRDPGPYFHGYNVKGGRFHGNLRLWESDPDCRNYCFHSPLPEIASQLLEENEIVLFYDQLFVKEPGANAPTRWHNDQPYWPVSGSAVLSFWTSLDAVDDKSGRMEFIRGSHLWNQWFQPEPFAKGGHEYEQNEEYEKIPDIDAARDNYDIVSWNMEPGDVLAFHGLTVHGAGANTHATRNRRGYTVRYCGGSATYKDAPGVNDMLKNPALINGQPLASTQYPLVKNLLR